MSDIKKSLLKNSSWNWLLFLINAVITFWMSPFLVHHLGNERYGFWTIIVSLIGYYGLMDIGIRNALVRFVAKFHAEQNFEKLNQVVCTGFAVFCCAAGGTLVASLVLAFSIPGPFSISPGLLDEARLTILVVGFGFALQFPLNALSGILIGLQRYDITARATIAMTVGQSICYVIALSRGYSLVAIALLNSLSGILTLAYMSWRGVRMLPGLRVRLGVASWSMFREMLSYSSFVFVIGVAGRLFTYTAPLIIAAKLDLGAVAIYSIPVMLVTYASNIVNNFSRVLQPFASSTQAAGKQDALAQTALWSSLVGLMIYMPIFILVFTIGRDFILIWMGHSFADGVVTVLPVLSVAYILAIAEMPLENILMGMGQVRVLTIILITESLVNIALMMLLIPRFGLDGAAWATALPLIVSRGLLVPRLASKTVGFPLRRFYLDVLGRQVLLMLPLLGGALLVRSLVAVNGYLMLTVISAVVCVIWVIIALVGTSDGRVLYSRLRAKMTTPAAAG